MNTGSESKSHMKYGEHEGIYLLESKKDKKVTLLFNIIIDIDILPHFTIIILLICHLCDRKT